MFPVLYSLKGILKTDDVVIDNPIFKLHYKMTCLLLVAFSVIVSTNQFFGEPINCYMTNHDIPSNVINTYCWIQSTYTMPSAHHRRVGHEVPHPGIDRSTGNDGERIYHQYYQWVVFFLFFQAAFFYVPRFIWKILEGGKIRQILLGLGNPIVPPDDKKDRVQKLAEYLNEMLGAHTMYAYTFFGCELLNFINVICQIYLTDAFLGGEFTEYGSRVLEYAQLDQTNRTDPMIQVFPRVTKCQFHQFGPSGDVMRQDALCILPINILNEKIFIFLWFWFILLAILSGLIVAYRVPLIFVKKIRIKVLSTRNRFARHDELEEIVVKSNVGDWLVMSLLGTNMNSLNYRDLITKFDQVIKADLYDKMGKNGSLRKLSV